VKGSAWWAGLLVLAVVALATRNVALLAFALVLGLAGASSALWARYCLSNVRYRRSLGAHHLTYGQETSLTIEFINAKPIPLAWLLARDQYPPRVQLLTGEVLRDPARQRSWLNNLLSLRWYERVTRVHRLKGSQRGTFQFGPVELASGDILGFQRKYRQETQFDTLIVYPKIVPVQALGLPAGRPMGDWTAARRVMENPLRFSTVRDYQPGDNPRHIHWKATARMGALQTKVFEPTNTLSLVLAVDVQTTVNAYGVVSEYLELVISAAASLAVHALSERYMVGLCANGIARGAFWTYVQPGRRTEHLQQLLTVLASLDGFRGEPFARMLHGLAPRLPFGGTLIALTALPDEALYELLLNMRTRGHPVLLLTVGDEKPDVPIQLPHYHLGGSDAWHRLETLELG
jgi:uncharacterized protein (DUF58 family)